MDWGALDPAAVPLLLFLVRGADLTLATLRVFSLIRGRPTLAWVLGFFEAVLFIVGAAGLLLNLTNLVAVLAYAAGFATGSVIGVTLESLLLPGRRLLRIYSPGKGSAISDALREKGYGVTETAARGASGTVDLIYCFSPIRRSRRVRRSVVAIDPNAVITVENVRSLVGGWAT